MNSSQTSPLVVALAVVGVVAIAAVVWKHISAVQAPPPPPPDPLWKRMILEAAKGAGAAAATFAFTKALSSHGEIAV